MIKDIHITQYRKLKNLDLEFKPGLNAISGTNGTCKTSLLHIISNSVRAVTTTCDWVKDKSCLRIINAVNAVTNPKVETLTRGDRQYNDPAHGVPGVLYHVDYWGHGSLGFRRHNSPKNGRYAIKPGYKKGAGETLPQCPVIYLGLSRLVPYGEFQNDDAISGIRNALPIEYQKELNDLYEDFTHYKITYNASQQMGDLKTRAEFSSNLDGVDSNTISAGEDNLYIILAAIVSLKYYYKSITKQRDVESILLIDELDAALHPSYQIKLLNVLRDYCKECKIQAVFTTHSMSAIENLLAKKDNVIYLIDNIKHIIKMDDPDFYKIKMHLSSLTKENIYQDKRIPIFSEDEEARFLLNLMLDYFTEEHSEEFSPVRHLFHLVNANLSANSLMDIFRDSKILRMTMSSICVLDGDHKSELENCIIALPGKNHESSSRGLSPEQLLLEYAQIVYDDYDDFWEHHLVINSGFSKHQYMDAINRPWEKFQRNESNGSVKVKRREFVKKLFNKEKIFFELLFKHWLHNPHNKRTIDNFYDELKKLFKKVAMYNEINPNDWK